MSRGRVDTDARAVAGPLLKGNAKGWRDSILVEYFHYTDLKGMDELYDLKVDPYEMKNAAGTNPRLWPR